MTAKEFLRSAEIALVESGCPDPKVDARRLLESAFSLPFAKLRLLGDQLIPPEIEAQLSTWLARRISGEPLQYIEGFQDFMGLRLRVDNRALIPRQDTETLAELAITCARSFIEPVVLDLCTGTGALALAIKKNVPEAKVTATDISEEALKLARENAEGLGVEIELLCGDLFAPVCGRKFDLIVSNPPYLTSGDMEALQREVRHEPSLALFGGSDGLTFYKRIGEAVSCALKPGGSAFFEVGTGQAKSVIDIFCRAVPKADITTFRDLPGIERVVALNSKA